MYYKYWHYQILWVDQWKGGNVSGAGQKSGPPSGDVQCSDFETQQQVQSAFEQDEIR
jgi:hypothetical protein